MNDLEERVYKFQTGELPGQPMSMHMGTSYLVNDLWKEVKRLRQIEENYNNREPASVKALDDIVKLLNAPPWDYPGQVVRDVEKALEEITKRLGND